MRVSHAAQHATTTVLWDLKPYLTAGSHGIGYLLLDHGAVDTLLLSTLRRITGVLLTNIKRGILYIINTIFTNKNLRQFSQ